MIPERLAKCLLLKLSQYFRDNNTAKLFPQSSTTLQPCGQRRQIRGVLRGPCLHRLQQGDRRDDSGSGVCLPVDISDRLRE
jgi:hypothetical protein